MSCYVHTCLALNKGGLEVSKKVQYVFVAQRAAKLCFVKLYEKLIQVWKAVVLQPIELQRRTATFWKPPNPLELKISSWKYAQMTGFLASHCIYHI